MEITECKSDLSCVKLGFCLREALLLRKMLEELATLNELHDEVYAVRLLENVVHSDDKRVINLVEDELLDLK